MTEPTPAFCQSYDEARKIYLDGELQAWDGNKWEDIMAGSQPFFSRRVEEYRRKPKPQPPVNLTPTYGGSIVAWHRLQNGRIVEHRFWTGEDFASWVWGKDLADIQVFKRIDITGYDLKKIAEQVNAG